ncbi:hypothetical protein Ddye_024742 [Dipteronia dyeriana]|uniref:RRM domain-containing protein n=1 Tax=Dipteronia dyeriana TaxID=168575 RepID=A0AAD9TWE5_9ROSI|nr:hypothetical protein Ddye_024742 [Dipteronia dyeriana]
MNERADRGVDMTLEVEISKVIEKGIAFRVNFNQSNEEDERQQRDGLQWNLDLEVAQIIETGVAVGFNCNGKKEEVSTILASKEKEDEDRKAYLGVFQITIPLRLVSQGRIEGLARSVSLTIVKEGEQRLAAVKVKAVKNGWTMALRKKRIDILSELLGGIKRDEQRWRQNFYEDGSIVKDLNKTFIALIPKKGNPKTLSDFRPISLVGSMYKIIAKILDSFVITEEIIHMWKRDHEGGVLVKLNFEKAYDSVDHVFLDRFELPFQESHRVRFGFFKTFGKVRNIYLAKANKGMKRGFTFVRFATLEEARRVAKMIKGMHMYRWPIDVKIALYGWNRRRTQSVVAAEKRAKDGQSSYGEHMDDQWWEVRRANGKRRDNISFAEVVRDERQKEKRDCQHEELETLVLNRKISEKSWVENCTIGVLKEFSSVYRVNKRLFDRGFWFSSKYLGGINIVVF